jgi:hypothetical protein
VVSEYCERVSYADQYDGRIEASTLTGKGLPPVTRQAFVSIQAGDDGRFSVTVRVNKVTGAGAEREVVGLDADLERVILRRLEARQAQKEQPPPRSTKATEGKHRLEVRADAKQVQVLAAFGDEELHAVTGRMSYEGGGLLVLEGNVRVQRRRDKEAEDIQCQKMVIDRKAGTVRVEGAGGVRQAVPLNGVGVVPALGPAPVALDFGFPVVKGPREDGQVFDFLLGLTR